MITPVDHQMPADVELIGSRIGRIDPANFSNPSRAALDDKEDDVEEENPDQSDELDDEPVDEDGDPTGEHDHHQDDNYALGGHVTRSGGI
ncbi:hypothetical protein [Spirosoma areae]